MTFLIFILQDTFYPDIAEGIFFRITTLLTQSPNEEAVQYQIPIKNPVVENFPHNIPPRVLQGWVNL